MQRKTDIIRLVVAVDYLIEVTAMAKGIIYIMTTSVKGLIKIGKTDNFKSRMAKLEQDGYWNVSGLHPFYAVKVDDYDKKEKLIHTMFSKSQVANSELFAIDKHIAKELLESFGGEQIFPEADKIIKEVSGKSSKGHEWKASVANRSLGNGCLYCARQYVIIGQNDLLITNPVLAKEWNYDKNASFKNGRGDDVSTPDKVTEKSGLKVWWKCANGHEWVACINNRSRGA